MFNKTWNVMLISINDNPIVVCLLCMMSLLKQSSCFREQMHFYADTYIGIFFLIIITFTLFLQYFELSNSAST